MQFMPSKNLHTKGLTAVVYISAYGKKQQQQQSTTSAILLLTSFITYRVDHKIMSAQLL